MANAPASTILLPINMVPQNIGARKRTKKISPLLLLCRAASVVRFPESGLPLIAQIVLQMVDSFQDFRVSCCFLLSLSKVVERKREHSPFLIRLAVMPLKVVFHCRAGRTEGLVIEVLSESIYILRRVPGQLCYHIMV